MPGVRVDGMNVFEVYDAAGQAVGRARSGQGPSLLECVTYRYYGHTLMDNPHSYRTEAEEQEWRARDPINYFRTTVLEEGSLGQGELDGIDRKVDQLIEGAIKFADESELPKIEELYSDVYVNCTLDQLKRGAGMEA